MNNIYKMFDVDILSSHRHRHKITSYTVSSLGWLPAACFHFFISPAPLVSVSCLWPVLTFETISALCLQILSGLGTGFLELNTTTSESYANCSLSLFLDSSNGWPLTSGDAFMGDRRVSKTIRILKLSFWENLKLFEMETCHTKSIFNIETSNNRWLLIAFHRYAGLWRSVGSYHYNK